MGVVCKKGALPLWLEESRGPEGIVADAGRVCFGFSDYDVIEDVDSDDFG